MTDADLAAAWTRFTPLRRTAGTTAGLGQRHGGQWAMFAFDTTEASAIGRRSRERTVLGQTEVECLLEMARCLSHIGEASVPR